MPICFTRANENTGMDLAYTSLKEMNANHYFEYTREFLNHTAGRTVEFNMLGNRMIMTDNPENIKEMMHTQVSTRVKPDNIFDLPPIVLFIWKR